MIRSLTVLLILAAVPAGTAAQSIGFGIAIGTAGPGGSVTMPVSARLQIRAAGFHAALADAKTVTRGGVRFDADRSLRVGAAALSMVYWPSTVVGFAVGAWLPFGEAHLDAMADDGLDIAGTHLSAIELGAAACRVRYPEVPAPAVSIVLGNPVSRGRVKPTLELGVVYLGRPSVSVDAVGRLDASTAWAGYVGEQLRRARWFPVAQIGLAVRIDRPLEP